LKNFYQGAALDRILIPQMYDLSDKISCHHHLPAITPRRWRAIFYGDSALSSKGMCKSRAA
jgi:hypothetical protein